MDDHLSVDEIKAFNRRAGRFFETRNAFAPHLGAPLRERKTMNLQEIDREVAKVSTAPRVSLADIEGAIALRYNFTAFDATDDMEPVYAAPDCDVSHSSAMHLLSICLLVLRNGFTVIGKSAPASPENFDAAMGAELAYRDACSQCWPLMGFALRERLYAASHGFASHDSHADEQQAAYNAGSSDPLGR